MSSVVGTANLSALASDLAAASGEPFQAQADALVASTGFQVVTFAKSFAPVRTGRLQADIGVVSRGRATITVGTQTVPYASDVEFGTGPRGEFGGAPIIIRPRKAQFLRFMANGKIIYTKKVVSKGMAPRPFLRPALERVVQPFVGQFLDQGALWVLKGPHAPETLMNAPATSAYRNAA